MMFELSMVVASLTMTKWYELVLALIVLGLVTIIMLAILVILQPTGSDRQSGSCKPSETIGELSRRQRSQVEYEKALQAIRNK